MRERGVFLVGAFVGVDPVLRKNGDKVPGLFRVQVDCGVGEQTFLRDASFFRTDNQTGEPTAMAASLAEYDGGEGAEVRVLVTPTASVDHNGKAWANLQALGIETISGAPSK